MNTMIGSGFAAAFAAGAARLSPSCRLSRPPYGHYSLIARSQALHRYFVQGRRWESTAPAVKDPDRVADPSTLRRWFRSLDCSLPPFSYLRRTMLAISARLGRTEISSLIIPCRCAGTPHFPFWPGSGLCGFRKLPPPTILAWEYR